MSVLQLSQPVPLMSSLGDGLISLVPTQCTRGLSESCHTEHGLQNTVHSLGWCGLKCSRSCCLVSRQTLQQWIVLFVLKMSFLFVCLNYVCAYACREARRQFWVPHNRSERQLRVTQFGCWEPNLGLSARVLSAH